MITNKAIQKKPEHKQMMQLQSWYEPALRTLDGLLEIRRANLRKIKGDEKNAAVTRDELIEMLMNKHRVTRTASKSRKVIPALKHRLKHTWHMI